MTASLMYRFVWPAVLLVWLAAAAWGAGAALSGEPTSQSSSPVRLPVPSESQIVASRKLISEVYPSDLARQTASERRLLAAKLLDAATATNDNPADRYVMLQEAMDLAAQGGDAQTITKAADLLEAGYLCDAAVQRADALAKCYTVAPSPALAGQVVLAEIAAADQAAANDDYETAEKYAQKASHAARTIGERSFISQVQSRVAVIGEMRKAFLRVGSAFAKLKADPNDPASNLAVGQYLCFNKGDWQAGLPHLARGSDPTLKQLSQNEINAAMDPSAQADLAEQWWNLAEQNPQWPQIQTHAHAADLYRQALPALTGLAKAVAQKRIDQVASTHGVAMLQPPITETKPKPDSTPSREIVGELIGGTRRDDGIVVITQHMRAQTRENFKPPVAFHIVAQTDSTNIRISYAARQIIFDWEVNLSEIRVDGGPANGRHLKHAGFIQPNTWADIDLLVMPDSMTIFVNGERRYHTEADFSDVNQPFGIFTNNDAVVQVKSVTVRTPS